MLGERAPYLSMVRYRLTSLAHGYCVFTLLQPLRTLNDPVYSLNIHTSLIIWKDYQNLESD